jgi:ribosomal-protein-alanine N-acetyltransferase
LIACELESDRFKHLYSASGACPIVGYMAYDWTRTKLTLLNFGVDYRFRREGVGTAMIEKLKSKLSAEQKTRIVLHVRETNLPAQLFFRAMGFRAVNVLRGAYEDTTEDAYVFQYRFR